jgi:hypothetical protein
MSRPIGCQHGGHAVERNELWADRAALPATAQLGRKPASVATKDRTRTEP